MSNDGLYDKWKIILDRCVNKSDLKYMPYTKHFPPIIFMLLAEISRRLFLYDI